MLRKGILLLHPLEGGRIRIIPAVLTRLTSHMISTTRITKMVQVDVWACACLAAEMLSGRPLFPGEDEGELVRRCLFLRSQEDLSALASTFFREILKQAQYFFVGGSETHCM